MLGFSLFIRFGMFLGFGGGSSAPSTAGQPIGLLLILTKAH